jgi:hypothetical protein
MVSVLEVLVGVLVGPGLNVSPVRHFAYEGKKYGGWKR